MSLDLAAMIATSLVIAVLAVAYGIVTYRVWKTWGHK